MCRVWNVQSVDSSFLSGFCTGILLSLITCGIYGYYFIYKLAEEVNIAAREMVSRLQDLLHLFYCHSLPAVFMLIIGTTNWEIV